MSSVKEEIELHISFLEGKLIAFRESALVFHIEKYAGDEEYGSPQLSLAVSLVKEELAFLKKLLEVYYAQE